ncbi:MAG: GTPase HflX [Deltaproteobacteria bacterium]|nr:GTPase HflX [Deltaproteobacteria bacterium]
MKTILVGIQLPKTTSEEHKASMKELGRLVKTLGHQVVGEVSQKKSSLKTPLFLGEGKLEILAQWTGGTGVVQSLVKRKIHKAALQFSKTKTVDEEEEGGDTELPKEKADLVVVDCELSPSQLRNMESATGVTVLDRTGVIIEIFGRHARTRSARLQVEIARLTYLAPRLRETGNDKQVGGGGVGAGETKLELDRRKIRDRIKELKSELASIANEHEVRRARRDRENAVALVGYTNAGKSSLMKVMTGIDVLVADKLFATLDTTIRPLYPETHPRILLSDTVGFIKKLPHDLIASFKSTLDEALNASLLLYLVDASDPTFRSQLKVTQNVLSEVGAGENPSWLVLNKCDLLKEPEILQLKKEFPKAFFISTFDKENIRYLRDAIIGFFETDMIESELFIPYTTPGVIGEIRNRMRVISESYDDKGTCLCVRARQEDLDALKKKFKM